MKTYTLKIKLNQQGNDDLIRLMNEACVKDIQELFTRSLSLFETVLHFQNKGYHIIAESPDGKSEELEHMLTLGC